MTAPAALVRSWTLETHSGRPLTVNQVAKLHRHQWANLTAATREEWGWLAKGWAIPLLDRAHITATPLHADRRSPQDTAACAPAVKAAIDGLVDAGVLSPRGRPAMTCDVCGRPVDPAEAHYPCQPGCPHALGMATDCDCDLIVHPDCCPDCTRQAAG